MADNIEYDVEFQPWPDEAPMQVYLSCCQEWTDWNDDAFEMLGMQEDIQGRDLMTFTCPECNETHDSLVRRKF
jgi:hypothetical protein